LVEAGETNTFAANELALQVKINARLSLAAGIGVRHNSDPPLGRKKTDTLTTLNLVYGF
jgi:putative salt-induced outer membrane protein